MLRVTPHTIPQELRGLPQWVLWKSEIRDGKPTKIPYCPHEPKRKAEADNPETWGTYEQAIRHYRAHRNNGIAGIGYEFSADDLFTGVDLDKCRDPKTGEIEPWAQDIITRLSSYTELSPSGRGVHILVKGKLPPGPRRKGKIEMYDRGRYFTMTGHHLEGSPATIETRQTALDTLHKEIFSKSSKESQQTPPKDTGPRLELSDFAIIDKAKSARNGHKFERLWGGDITGYDSPSEATAALLEKLVFWCGPNPDSSRIDRLFRQSGLMRDKWDRPQSGSTWGALEIDKAISRTTEFYTPKQRPKNQEQEGQTPTPTEPEAKPTQAELLLKLAAEAELFHDLNRKGYATIPVKGHFETWPIKSMAFRDWLRGLFYKAHGKPPGGQALQDSLDLLAAQARFDGQEHEVNVRVAHAGGKVYVDLANDEWQAVEISPQGWQVVDRPPVKFRRPRGLAPLPLPEPGGSLDALKPFVNCTPDDWLLIVAWLIGAFSPGPYPALIFQGEQGTAKTTTAKVLKSLVDPAHTAQRTAPRDIRDLMISAANSWCLSFDNLSVLRDWLSDGFCRLATGGGLSTRELYTNDDETILDAMRPVILNGIDSLVSRADLADRAILLELPRIQDNNRQREADFWREFEAAQPGIMGAVFDCLAAALANVHTVKLARLPRMADFATWIVAAEAALPWEPGNFLAAYTRNRASVVEHSLEGDPVAVALRSFMESRYEWEGTPTELLNELTEAAGDLVSRGKTWPKAANGLSNRLRRAATFLRVSGIEIESAKIGGGRRLVSIRKGLQKTAQTATTAQSQELCGVTCGDPCGDSGDSGDPTAQTAQRPPHRKVTNDEGLGDSGDAGDKIQDFSNTDSNGQPLDEVEL
jgi:hypothetical protein